MGGRELRAGPDDRVMGMRRHPPRALDRRLVMVAQKAQRPVFDQPRRGLDREDRVRPIADDVAEQNDAIRRQPRDRGEDGFGRLAIGVQIREDGEAHGRQDRGDGALAVPPSGAERHWPFGAQTLRRPASDSRGNARRGR